MQNILFKVYRVIALNYLFFLKNSNFNIQLDSVFGMLHYWHLRFRQHYWIRSENVKVRKYRNLLIFCHLNSSWTSRWPCPEVPYSSIFSQMLPSIKVFIRTLSLWESHLLVNFRKSWIFFYFSMNCTILQSFCTGIHTEWPTHLKLQQNMKKIT